MDVFVHRGEIRTNMLPVSFDNYTGAGDVTVISVCIVMGILLLTSYVRRTGSLRVFISIIGMLAAAAAVNLTYHVLLTLRQPIPVIPIYALRILYNALLFGVFFLFTRYVVIVSGLAPPKARRAELVAGALLVVMIGTDIWQTVSGTGFRIMPTGEVVNRTNLFMIGYVLFVILLAVLMRQAQSRLYKQVMNGFYGTMIVAVLIHTTQMTLHQSSLTTMTFVFPVIAMMYIMHSNPYNVTLGTVDIRAMEDMVRTMYIRKEPFIFISLLLPEYDAEGKELPEGVQATVRKFSVKYFRNCVLFQLGNGNIVLMASKRRNADCEKRIENLLKDFEWAYRHFQLAYKIVVGESVDEISKKNEYASLIRSVQRSQPENTVYRMGPEDVTRFNQNEYILQALADINNRRDIDDERVLAFCQPVYNLQTGRFDTAEALMRLKLDGMGLVTPDKFIPLAEDYGYIHMLTEIILHKTCKEIRRLTEEGFQLSRISVNVSALELKDSGFCADISEIISHNGIPGRMIAIELTESRSEKDFIIMKQKIEELRRQGIRFYLDDFGTGYSNMERIVELPFDIIKFDRSLVIASASNDRSGKIVENMAHMLKDMKYAILFEGVEDASDENRCKEMSASYLQGFKYSRPVPIEKLREYLPKAG